jgi:hypothetical protein
VLFNVPFSFILHKMDSLLITTADEKNQIRKLYDISEAQIKESVELIKAWIAKQPHLPQNLTGLYQNLHSRQRKICYCR